jgi:hypothetical protein
MSTQERASKRLANLIDSRHHLILIRTFEERRVLHDVRQIAEAYRKKSGKPMAVMTWDVATGLCDEAGKPIKPDVTKDVTAGLGMLHQRKESAFYILRDVLEYDNYVNVRRQLRTMSQEFTDNSEHFRVLIITSSHKDPPPELGDEMAVLDYGLPTEEESLVYLDNLWPQLEQVTNNDISDVDRTACVRAAAGLTFEGFRHALLLSLRKHGTLVPGTIAEAKKLSIQKSGLLTWEDPQPIEALGGLAPLKRWLAKRGIPYTDPALALERQLPSPKGLLLLGIPGGGKSLAAKVVSSMWGLPLLRLDIGQLMQSLLGQSEANLRKAIAVAEANAPVVLFVDEIEKGLAGASGSQNDTGVMARLFGRLLSWMSDKTSPVFIVATANRIDMLPPEFLRKGRFDEIFFVDVPTPEERAAIWLIHLSRYGISPSQVDFGLLVHSTDDFTGAEIEATISDAMFDAAADRAVFSTEYLVNSIKPVQPIARTMNGLEDLREFANTRARHANGA